MSTLLFPDAFPIGGLGLRSQPQRFPYPRRHAGEPESSADAWKLNPYGILLTIPSAVGCLSRRRLSRDYERQQFTANDTTHRLALAFYAIGLQILAITILAPEFYAWGSANAMRSVLDAVVNFLRNFCVDGFQEGAGAIDFDLALLTRLDLY